MTDIKLLDDRLKWLGDTAMCKRNDWGQRQAITQFCGAGKIVLVRYQFWVDLPAQGTLDDGIAILLQAKMLR
ncbi:hypothetical protein OCA8868_00713 [Octadecabacter ascidiaceicola]|uniref:Uncharacterized protein n=1 Tax=Octadecabacter ascidiaceicola TaxID=1655543 RepID=A0A238JNT6_9RHOB|nr:hypothetical protein OCA8868_00713 [Octadecabacter ascidiaceicola]